MPLYLSVCQNCSTGSKFVLFQKLKKRSLFLLLSTWSNMSWIINDYVPFRIISNMSLLFIDAQTFSSEANFLCFLSSTNWFQAQIVNLVTREGQWFSFPAVRSSLTKWLSTPWILWGSSEISGVTYCMYLWCIWTQFRSTWAGCM